MNLCLIVPDKRWYYWKHRYAITKDGKKVWDYFNYNPDYAPEVCLYTVPLEAKAVPSTTQDAANYYTCTPQWTNSIAGDTTVLGETFELYKVDANGEPTGDPIYTGPKQSYSYDEPRQAKGYFITYVVKATTSTGMVVWSNNARVYIPGTKAAFKIEANLNSTYDSEKQVNNYTVPVVMTNDPAADFNPGNDMTKEKKFTLYRYNRNSDGTLDTATKHTVAVMTLANTTEKSDSTDADGEAWSTVDYTITYPDQADASTTGKVYYSEKGYDLRTVKFDDIFSASTELNAQPSGYVYTVDYTYTKASDNTLASIESNEDAVLVLKTTPTIVAARVYTRADVDGENGNKPTLEAGDHDEVTFGVQNNSNILYYNLMRNGDRVGYAQRNLDGTYTGFGLDSLGDWVNTGDSNNGTITVSIALNPVVETNKWWIEIVRKNATDSLTSTFGTLQQDREHIDLKLTVTEAGQYPRSHHGDVYRGVIKDVLVTLSSNTGEVATAVGDNGYRMWRKIGDKDWELINLKASDEWNNEKAGANASTSVKDGWQWDWTQRDTYDTPWLANGDSLKVQYVMHVYMKNKTASSSVSSSPRKAESADTSRYTIAESSVTVTFSNNTVTGVEDVNAAPQASHVKVFGIDGRMIYDGDSRDMHLPSGLWIVTSPTGTKKVAIP